MRFLASLILAFAVLIGTAQAQSVVWKRIRGWVVTISASQNGCNLLTPAAAGPLMQIDYTNDRRLWVIVGNDAWKSLEVDKDYSMTVFIDDRPHANTMKARRDPAGRPFLEHKFDLEVGEQFLADFRRGNRLTVMYEGRQLAAFVLQASQAAVEELLRCQAAQGKGTPTVGTPSVAPGDDPFKRRPGTGAAPDKSAPMSSKLTAEQHLAAVRLMANLMTRMPGFRILNEEEVKAINARLANIAPAVVWRSGDALGTLQVFPDRTEAHVAAVALGLVTAADQSCNGQYDVSMARDVRSSDVRRVHFTCTIAGTEFLQRYVVMPFGKDGLYVFSTIGALKDKDVIVRAEELLRNALFEVVKR